MRVFIVALLSIALFFNVAAHAQDIQLGDVKSLVVKTTSGKTFDLSKQKGKVVMIAFWASWCTICKVEMNNIDDLYSKYSSLGFEIIGVNVDGKIGWGKELKYPITIMENYTAGDFGFPRTVPLIYIVGKNGAIAEKLANPEEIKSYNLENIVKNLLNPPSPAQTPINKPVETTVLKPQENSVSKLEKKKMRFNFKKN